MKLLTTIGRSGKINLELIDQTYQVSYGLIRDYDELVDHIDLLHPSELQYFHSLEFEKRKKSYLLGRLAAKLAINEVHNSIVLNQVCIDWSYLKNPIIKYLDFEEPMSVTISHSGSLAIAIVFDCRLSLGVDIERILGDMTSIKYHLNDAELKVISNLNIPSNDGYTLAWTIKESLSKALKTGMILDFKTFLINSIRCNEQTYLSEFIENKLFKTFSFIATEYICSIAIPSGSKVDFDPIYSDLNDIVLNREVN